MSGCPVISLIVLESESPEQQHPVRAPDFALELVVHAADFHDMGNSEWRRYYLGIISGLGTLAVTTGGAILLML